MWKKSGPVIDIAKKHGWYIFPNPAVNGFGIPVGLLKYMYLDAYKLFNATFYGYANGDILFDVGLNETLSVMSQHISFINVTLLFGIRRNYKLLPEVNYTSDPLWPPSRIAQLVKGNQTKLFRYDAFDYFFVTKSYPLHKIKPLIIGWGGFDTYFAALANNLKLTTIEGTGSIMALHQNHAHHSPRNASNDKYNRILVGGDFNYSPGFAGNAKYGSTRCKNGTVVFKCRHCNDSYARKLFCSILGVFGCDSVSHFHCFGYFELTDASLQCVNDI